MKAAASALLGLAGLFGLAACATQNPAAAGPSPNARAAADGARVAQVWCVACHSLDAGPSPRPTAPPFRTLGARFNGITWERTVSRIAAGQHGEMPAAPLSETDIRNLRAFIDSLS